MSINPRLRVLLTISGAVLTVGLAGCGTSTPTARTEATTSSSTSSSQAPTTSPTSPTTSSTSPNAAPPASASAAAPVLIRIKGFKFTVPPSVGPGVKVAVKNEDAEAHTVTSLTKGAFDANVPPGGKAVTFTAPTKPGKYPFTCGFHADMKGTLVVT